MDSHNAGDRTGSTLTTRDRDDAHVCWPCSVGTNAPLQQYGFCLGGCWLGGTIIFVKLKLLQVFEVEHTLLVVSGNQIEPSDLANRSWKRGKSSLIGPGSSVATIRMGKTRGRVLRARFSSSFPRRSLTGRAPVKRVRESHGDRAFPTVLRPRPVRPTYHQTVATIPRPKLSAQWGKL
jgi:hypothetical protein